MLLSWCLQLMDAATGADLGQFIGHDDVVHGLVCGQSYVASASADCTALLWSTSGFTVATSTSR